MYRAFLQIACLLYLPHRSAGIAVRGGASANTEASREKIRYVLLGPEDAGTNLLEQFIEANWPNTFLSSQEQHALWKHSNSGAADIYAVLSDSGFGNISKLPAVAMVRSPISLISSWMREPYDMAPCVQRPVIEMDEPCLVDLEARKAGVRSRAGDTSTPQLVKYSSTMDVYNHYLQLYHDLGADGKFASFLQINYEDLVYSPEVVAELLGHTLGVDPPLDTALVEEPAKNHGHPASRSSSLEKLSEHSYMSTIGEEGLRSLCPLLNVSLVSDLKEGTFLEQEELEHARPYTYDCEGYLHVLKM